MNRYRPSVEVVVPTCTAGPVAGTYQRFTVASGAGRSRPSVYFPSPSRSWKIQSPTVWEAVRTTVRFDANVSGGLPWRFEPETNSIEVRIGETITVNYRVSNLSARETVGQASYNVSPPTAGFYFTKVNCFCFTEQRLKPNEMREMPVVFYVDPELVKDSDLDGLNTITLSYTFYPMREPAVKPLAASEPDKRKGNL